MGNPHHVEGATGAYSSHIRHHHHEVLDRAVPKNAQWIRLLAGILDLLASL